MPTLGEVQFQRAQESYMRSALNRLDKIETNLDRIATALELIATRADEALPTQSAEQKAWEARHLD